ncbi:MAG: MFS transporter [Oscillospiraceae bacterium]|nr:MFS transporter [Oscillospiraceae bacterium]
MQQSWKRKFWIISIGQIASLIGSSAVQFALIWWIASETGSAIMMGLSGLVAFLPATLLSPLAGIVADRYHRKYICIFADLFIGVSAAIFSVLLWLFEMPVWTALIILFFRSIGNAFHQPAFQAMIPQFVPAEDLVKIGGWNQLIASGSFLLGPAIGAALYAAFSLPVILLTDLLGAIIASVMLAAVQIAPMQRVTRESQNTRKELKEGIEVFRADKALTLLIVVETLCMIFYMPLSSFYPLMTSDYFNATAWHGSVVEILYAAGMMVAAFLFSSVIKVKQHLLFSYIGMLGVGITSAIGGLLPPDMWAWLIFALACGVMGAFGNVHSIPLIAYMQTTIPAEKMGRAFSLIALAASLSMPVGLLIASPVAETVGVNVWFLLSGVGTVLITATGLFLHQRMQRQ